MINKDRENFQGRGGDIVYIISPLTSQLRRASWKITIIPYHAKWYSELVSTSTKHDL